MINERLEMALEYCEKEGFRILSFDLHSDMIHVETELGGDTYIRIKDIII